MVDSEMPFTLVPSQPDSIFFSQCETPGRDALRGGFVDYEDSKRPVTQ